MTRRIGSLSRRTWSLSAVSLAAAALTAVALATPSAGLAAVHSHAVSYPHRSVGNLDCNGRSPIQRAVKPGGIICAEIHFAPGGKHFKDNGYYVGHDEPTVQFYSNRPGSSTNVTYAQTLPRDPRALPTVKGPLKDTTHFFELMPTLWYAMALCDPNSFPQLPCTPDSDTNTPSGNYPGGGSAFLELQFYPPGFAPFANGISSKKCVVSLSGPLTVGSALGSRGSVCT